MDGHVLLYRREDATQPRRLSSRRPFYSPFLSSATEPLASPHPAPRPRTPRPPFLSRRPRRCRRLFPRLPRLLNLPPQILLHPTPSRSSSSPPPTQPRSGRMRPRRFRPIRVSSTSRPSRACTPFEYPPS